MKQFAQMSGTERAQLKRDNIAMYNRLRAEWLEHTEGVRAVVRPLPPREHTAADEALLNKAAAGYELLSGSERHQLKQRHPLRFEAARLHWMERGEPNPPKDAA